MLALTLALALPGERARALDPKYFAGHFNFFERQERYQSVLGGSVTLLRSAGHDEFELVGDALLLQGVISGELASHVQRLLAQRSIEAVYFDSPGGDLLAGMEIGRMLQMSRAMAVVQPAAQCKSACALAFLGSRRRLVMADSTALGFHRQYRIVDGKVVYGDPSADEGLIRRYLRSIEVSGISAEEILATTGEANFSDKALEERGLVTDSKSFTRGLAKELLEMSGTTRYEIISATCFPYDGLSRQDPRVQSSGDLLARWVACAGRVPANREPLLRLGLPHWPVPYQLELKYFNEHWDVLHSTDPEAVGQFNAAVAPTTYRIWLSKRQSVREAQSREPTRR